MSPASDGVGDAALGLGELALERGQLGPRVEHGGERGAVVALDDLRERGQTSPRRLVTVPASGCSSPARMRSSVDLPPPLGPSTPMRAPAASSRSRPGEHLAAAERLRDAARRQQRDGRYELSSVVALQAGVDRLLRDIAVLPAVDVDLLALRLLVHRVEVLDLGAQLAGEAVDALDLVPRRVVGGHAHDLVGLALLVVHPQHADGADLDQAAGERGRAGAARARRAPRRSRRACR